MNQQLSMFEDHFQAVAQAEKERAIDEYLEDQRKFWMECYGWKPAVGKIAIISSTIAFCETSNRRNYAYCMRVKVLEINGTKAKVETTKEWEEATYGHDIAGNIYRVHVGELAPKFNNGTMDPSCK